MATSTFKKGENVWYKTRDGTFVEAKVASVDLSIRPVSYGIYISGSDNLRETESPRLRSRTLGQKAPTEAGNLLSGENRGQTQASQPEAPHESEHNAKDGHKKGRDRKENGSSNLDVNWSAMRRRPHTLTAAFKSPAPNEHLQKGDGKQHTRKTAFRPPPDEDDFGEFSGADVEEAANPQTRAGPIPLSAFGEDDDTAVEEQNPLEIAWNTLSPVAYSTSAAPPHKRPELQGIAQSYPYLVQPPQAENQGMPLQSLKPAISSQLFPARDIVNGASQDLQKHRGDRMPSSFPENPSPRGGSPKSCATQSDDFGDFEDADADGFSDPEASAAVSLPGSSVPPAESAHLPVPVNPVLQKVLQQPKAAPSKLGQQELESGGLLGQNDPWRLGLPEGQELRAQDIPWFLNPHEAYLNSLGPVITHSQQSQHAAQEGSSLQPAATLSERVFGSQKQPAFGSQAQGLPQGRAQTASHPLQSQRQPKAGSPSRPSASSSQQAFHLAHEGLPIPPARHEHVPAGLMASAVPTPLSRGSEASACQLPYPPHHSASHKEKHSRSQQPVSTDINSATASFPLPLLQAMGRMPNSQVAGPSPVGIAMPDHLLSEAREVPLPVRDGQAEAFEDRTRRREEEQAVEAEAGRILYQQAWQGPVIARQMQLAPRCSYSEAWTQMMEVCAAELERGCAILQRESQLPPHMRRLTGARGKDYLRALGQLYLSSLLLQSAMETHVQQHHRPAAFQDHAHRCYRAWSQGPEGPSLEEAVFRVAPQMPQHVERLPRQTSTALSEAPRWHQLRQRQERQWEDGLCSISLLPLDQLEDLHVTSWEDERPCLVLLANLWTNKVNSRPPQLQGWAM